IYEVRHLQPAGTRLDIFEPREGAYELGKDDIKSFVEKYPLNSVCVYRCGCRVLIDFPPERCYEDRGEYGWKYTEQDPREWIGPVPVVVIDSTTTLIPAGSRE